MVESLKDLKEFIVLFPEILQYYFVGYIFLSVFKKIINNPIEDEHFNLLSIMISFIFTSFIGCFKIQNSYIAITISICVSILSAVILAIICKKIGLKLFHKTFNSIWQDILDSDKGNIFKICLKDNTTTYIGHFRLLDEDKQWIFLNSYKIIQNVDGKEFVEDSRVSDNKPGILIKIDEIKTVQVYYDPNTKNEFCRKD